MLAGGVKSRVTVEPGAGLAGEMVRDVRLTTGRGGLVEGQETRKPAKGRVGSKYGRHEGC